MASGAIVHPDKEWLEESRGHERARVCVEGRKGWGAQLREVQLARKEPEGDGREALWLAKGDLTCKRKSRTRRAH